MVEERALDEQLINDFEASFKRFSGKTMLRSSSSGQVDVSIICPTFNHRYYIERTLFGFLSQEISCSVEILIFDDCSTDGTTEFLEQFCSFYPDLINLIVQPYNKFSRGEANACEFFSLARGRFIAYCEGDDFWINPRKLATQFDYMERNSHVALTYGSALFADANGCLIDAYSSETNYRNHKGFRLEVGVNLFTLTSMFRSELSLFDVKGKNIYLDIILWSLCGEIGEGHFLDDIGSGVYRVHTRGLNSGASQKTRFTMLRDTYLLLFFNKFAKGRFSALVLLLRLILISCRRVLH